ncbi:MAG: ankyrin repeat domain-containing protein [Treponema sp.]|jgi:ankyrin repeat protein|nr:ankyrin repeat domain-containing protein [Treponema sp.]
MKYKLFTIAILLVVFLVSGCKSAPAREETVFSLLAEGKVAEAKELFRGKTNVSERDDEGRTTLHIAAEMGDPELASFLIALGADVNALDNRERTPLAISAEKFDAPTGAVLAAGGADIHRPLSSGAYDTIAQKSFQNEEFADAILTAGNVNSTDSSGRTVLHLAAQGGYYAMAAPIVAKGGEVNKKDSTGKTALDTAFLRTDSVNHAHTAEKLILAGGASSNPFFACLAPAVRSSNYNIRLADGYTVYHYAAQEGYSGYIEYLAGKRADVNAKNNSGAAPLHEAARNGQLYAMEQLVAAGADVNAQDAKGNTPMHLAIPLEQHRAAVSLLLNRGANPNLRDEHGEIPLQVVITLHRDYEIVEDLLLGGSEVSNRNIDGKTALYMAVEEDSVALIPLLLAWNSDVFAADNTGLTPIEKAIQEERPALDELITTETVQKSDSAGNTILHIAVRNRADQAITTKILDRNAVVNARNKEGNTALHIAVINNDEDSGNLLIARGADIFAPNSAGESPLYLAFHSSGSVREWMLNEKTLEARDGLGNTALHYAAQWMLAQHIPLMVRRGARLEAANATGETPLFWAARADSPETVEALLRQGALIGARDSLGNSSLHSAVRWNAQKAAPVLIGAGLGVNSQNLAGKAPLHDAVRLGLNDIEELLIAHGAALDIRDNQGNTPLMEAVIAGFPGAAERLTDRGADPVARNNSGDTPLHMAVVMQRVDLVTLLLGCGASIHARNSQGITPFNTALNLSPYMVSTLLTKDRIYAADDDGLSPLHIAVKQRAAPAMIQAIIARGCRISAADREGRTALRLALDMDSYSEAKVLADAGSDVFAAAIDGRTPADLAIAKGPDAIQSVFSGKAIGTRDGSGNTVLHYAAKTGDTAAINTLIGLGADRNIKNIASESPAEIARRWNHPRAEALLQ